MAPTPEDFPRRPGQHDPNRGSTVNGDAVVISGVSTVMPGSRNIKKFSDNLFDKVNMVKCSKTRLTHKYPELAKYHGVIPDLDGFDAQFFMVYQKLSQAMDGMTRKLLEHSYQAVFDAGVCPSELSGKSIGVFVACGVSESEKACAITKMYLGIVGSNRAMCANRISYYLNLKGPSILVDGGSAGTAVALEKACASITSGQCEAAIVGGARLLLHPQSLIHYHRLVPVCPDGNCKAYDANADGHSLSEGVSVIFLQKHKDAKRVYASIRHIKAGFDGSTKEGQEQTFGYHRDPEFLIKFLKDFYDEAKVPPSEVEYVEGFGAAILKADKSELEIIDEVFCKNRTVALPVGSVISNVGFTDAVSCLTSLVKLILAYQKGLIAANINYTTPCEDVSGVREGRIRIVTEHEKFQRTFAALNNFSFSGINAHVLLEGFYKPKNISQHHFNLPQLVTASGRQEASVQKILDELKNHSIDPEEISLLRNIYRMRIPKHLARGFGIFTTNSNQETVSLKEEVDYYDDARRPLWFVYSGMGSQWTGMGTKLMQLPVFAAVIERCHKTLEPKGIDLIKVLTSPDETIFDNILNSFIGIAAVQIGLTDVLRAVGLVPDNIIGHSVGELGCAYADGCLTAEEMILMAYCRGLVSVRTPFIKGSMAAVGMGYKQISKLVPPEIEVACHNGPESSTLSGPADKMNEFVAQLSAQGVFAKEVSCSNIAYHSRYITAAGPSLLTYLKEIVATPKARTKRWLSTSIPQDKWEEPLAQFCSAEYHTNNLLSHVLFEETIRLIPSNAVLVEIAPHGLLQAILKRSLPVNCKNIPLTRREHPDNALFMLEALGKLYMQGYDMTISKLYPEIEYPVSTETRSLSHLVEWMYAEKLKVCQYINVERKKKSVYKPTLSTYDEEYQYLLGNIINGKNLFPFAGVLVLVWETIAMTMGKAREQVKVQFKDLELHIQPLLNEEKSLKLTIALQRGSGRFEVTYEKGIIANGYVIALETIADLPKLVNDTAHDLLSLDKNDVYKLMNNKGYGYQNEFQSIQKVNIALTQAEITWSYNWVTFIDAALQLCILRRDHKGISEPKYIKRLCIDVIDHIRHASESRQRNNAIDAVFSETHNSIRAGGLTIEHITFRDKPCLLRQLTSLKELTFVPYNDEESDIITSLYAFLQIIAENRNKYVLNTCYISDLKKPCILESIQHLLNSPPVIMLNVDRINKNDIKNYKNEPVKHDFIFLDNIMCDENVFEALYQNIPPDTFIINVGEGIDSLFPATICHKICARGKGTDRIELFKWKPLQNKHTTMLSVINTSDLEYLETVSRDLTKHQKLLILAPYPSPPELKEFVKVWKSESCNIVVAMFNQKCDHRYDMEYPNFELVYNILDNGIWGGEYFIPMHINAAADGNVALKIEQFGNLDTLKWVGSNLVSKEDISVTIHYAGLNTYDAKKATAEVSIKDSTDCKFGMDFSGTTERGDRIMGLISNGSTSKKVVAQSDLMWPVPKHWSLEDAATVPLPYCFAFYCLGLKCKLVRGMNVLIHGGAGALGQAAISICLANKINIFTTVSNLQKKRLLLKIFPDLPADHIGNSRDSSFQSMISHATKEEGCHIIISTVSGHLKQATLHCCATSGITLDTVPFQIQENFTYGMYNMTKSRSYARIDFSSIFTSKNLEEMKLLQVMVSEGIARGYVRPLTRTVYSPQEAPRALRLLAGSRHRGRVLLNLQLPLKAVQSTIICSSNTSFLIMCDQESFGLQIAEKLYNAGVKKIYIHHPKQSPYVEFKISSLSKHGVKAHISSKTLKNKESIVNLIEDCSRLGPVEGIFIVNTYEKSQNIIIDLDLESRKMCPELRYFAVINETVTDFANEVILKRAEDGLPALYLQFHSLEQFYKSANNNKLQGHDAEAINVIEKALCSKKPLVLAYSQPIPQKSLNEEVTRIIGRDVANIYQADPTLEQIGIDEGKTQEICNIVEDKFNIIISKESMAQMKVSEFKKLGESLTGEKQMLTGLSGYFNYIDNDELLANCNMILMPTLVHNSDLVSLQRAEEFDSNLTYLCIVPGLESCHKRFCEVTERLKLPALVLQPGFDVQDESIEHMARRLVNVMQKNIKNDNRFYLLGYEFGVIVAIEMANILEKQGKTGTVYCLGGAPEDIYAILEEQFSNYDIDTLQNMLIEHTFTLITKSDSKELRKEMRDTKNWNEKVSICTHRINNRSPYTMDYIRAVLNMTYSRIIMVRNHVWKGRKLKSKIIILKAKMPKGSVEYLAHYSDATVHDLKSTLPCSPQDLECAAIVNKYLEPEILQDFYNKNRCETALLQESDELGFEYIDD